MPPAPRCLRGENSVQGEKGRAGVPAPHTLSVTNAAYNLAMLRAAACALLVAVIVSGSLMAQRGSMVSRSGIPASSAHFGSTSHFRGSFSQRPFSRDHFHHNRTASFFYPYFFPYDEPYGYAEPYIEVVEREPAPAVVPPVAPQPPAEPKVIEIPGAASQTPAKPLPPTIFILSNGERLETSRFLLRANDLSVTIDRHQRTIPLDQLNLDATIAANRDRGINLEIPADSNEISLRF
jgi:hypothetical protein